MKVLLYIYTGLFMLISNGLCAQIHIKQKLQVWIQTNGYVALTDMADLPKSILPYYQNIKTGIYKQHAGFKSFPEFTSFYVSTKSIINARDVLSMIIYPISGLKDIKFYEDKEREENEQEQLKHLKDTSKHKEHLQIIDSFGGSSGEYKLRLVKGSHKITFAQFQ